MTMKKAIVVCGILLALLVGSARTADAHAIAVYSDPPDGAVLTDAPQQINITFTNAILPEFTTVRFMDGDGAVIAVAPPRVTAQSGSAVVLTVDLPALAPNAYRLLWQSRSQDDLHLTSGSVIFGLKHSPPSSRPVDITAVAPVEVMTRWLILFGIAGALGALLVRFFIIDADVESDGSRAQATARRLRWFGCGSSILAFVGEGALLGVQVMADPQAKPETVWRIVGGTDYGLRWLIMQAALVGLALTIWLTAKARGRRLWLRFIGFVVVLAIVQPMNSHSDRDPSFSLLKVGVDALHVLAASVWIGGVAALLISVWPLFGRENGRARTYLLRFGRWAALSLVALVATGLYKSSQQVATVDAAFGTFYGQALLVKIELVFFVALLGLVNTAMLRPAIANRLRQLIHRPSRSTPFAARRVRQVLVAEAVLMGGILLAASLLAATPPARGPQWESPAQKATRPETVSINVADLVASLSVKPNRPGQNFISVGVFNTRRPAPAPIENVDIRLVAPGDTQNAQPITATRLDESHYQIAGSQFSIAGDWTVSLTVNRRGLAPVTTVLLWAVLPPKQPLERRAKVVSDAPLAPLLTILAILVVVAAALVLARPRLNGAMDRFSAWLRAITVGRYMRRPDQPRDLIGATPKAERREL